MLAMSPLCPTLGWEYPIELGTDKASLFDNFDFDSMFLANNNFSSSDNHQTHDYQDNNQEHVEYDVEDDDGKQQQQQQRSESLQGTISSSSTDHHQLDNNNNNNNSNSNTASLSKKLNHNASERDRRKKINNMYSSLRALLPATDQRRKLSIPSTVARVLEYIPELQKEVDDLTHKKKVFLSKLSAIQGNAFKGGFIQEEKPKNCGLVKETTSCSISVNKLGDQEMVIQLSAFERISLADMLLLLEKNGFLVIDVSSFQSFGGTTFYNLHLWMEGRNNVDYEKLNEMLQSLIQKQKQMQMYS